MKHKLIIASALVVATALGSCAGDHSSKSGGDTTNLAYPMPANLDTSKTTNTTGESGNVDNSGSGGTKIAKDSSALQLKGDTTSK